MHPVGALVVGGVASVIFIQVFTWLQRRPQIDDVLGVWPLRTMRRWGGIAAGIFGQQALGGIGGVKLHEPADWHPDGHLCIAVMGALVI